jgi:FKBP-type peptidyl-prolyl cis-trans isomerase FkpA
MPQFRRFAAVVALGGVLFVAFPAVSQTAATTGASATAVAPPSKVAILERKLGDGATANSGEPVLVHYTGYLWDPAAPDNKGKQFDSSLKRPAPLGFIIGAGRVIKGWDEGIVGMKVGGQRTLTIPADKAYGAKGAGAVIPPNSALVFDVELMGVIGKTQSPKAEPSEFVPPKRDGAQK